MLAIECQYYSIPLNINYNCLFQQYWLSVNITIYVSNMEWRASPSECIYMENLQPSQARSRLGGLALLSCKRKQISQGISQGGEILAKRACLSSNAACFHINTTKECVESNWFNKPRKLICKDSIGNETNGKRWHKIFNQLTFWCEPIK